MAENKRTVAVFDFDGTLTTKDTLLEFIKFSCGTGKFYFVFLLYIPLLVLMKLKLYPNWECKQKVFAHFFKGMKISEFSRLGKDFAKEIENIRKESMIAELRKLREEGASIYVISASIDEWVRPFCTQLGALDVISTKVEIDSLGCLTGRFLTLNCYGQEKVRRLLEIEPNRKEYILVAYGDSQGDKELLEFADRGILIK